MKLADIVNTVAKELGTSDLKEINKILKAESGAKFRIAGKALGHFGFTGQIKSISEEGVKVFMANKVSLIRLAVIETFEKAKPRAERPMRTAKFEVTPVPAKASPKKKKTPAKGLNDLDEGTEDFEDDGDFDDEEFRAKKLKKSKAKVGGKSGSKFIPAFKK